MSRKSFAFRADTINGVIQEFPPTMTFFCGDVTPIGIDLVRDFDEDACGIVKRVFLILYNGSTFGTTQFKSRDEYDQYIQTQCNCCPQICYVKIGDCDVMIGNCLVSMF
jgi:hypothetical protein